MPSRHLQQNLIHSPIPPLTFVFGRHHLFYQIVEELEPQILEWRDGTRSFLAHAHRYDARLGPSLEEWNGFGQPEPEGAGWKSGYTVFDGHFTVHLTNDQGHRRRYDSGILQVRRSRNHPSLQKIVFGNATRAKTQARIIDELVAGVEEYREAQRTATHKSYMRGRGDARESAFGTFGRGY